MRDAILRELDRGGQVFYVHNRVETIEAQAEQLRRLLPDARFVVGHGQMPEGALEKVMIAFAAGEADVLVCTTIIESGLDIPNANTIIIDRADTLGLAQLYQLRGRVGRSSRRAYAYLLYRRRERLSDEARKRLQAIFNASELGAGFQIALSDLEIRGAGQHPRRRAVRAHGRRRLRPVLADAGRGGRGSRRRPVRAAPRSSIAPQAVVDLPVDAHLPDDYVPDEAQKLELYRRLARARTAGDIAAFRQEVTDRFGPMPASVTRLVEVAELRLAAEEAGVSSISREEGRLVVRFGAGLTRAVAMRLLGDGGLPGVRPTDVTFASNQVRIRVPRDPAQGVGSDAGRRRAPRCGGCRSRLSRVRLRIRQTVGMPTKVILDVDTGTDDAVALMTAALSPDLELVGATTVNGNTTVDYTRRTRFASSTGSGCRRSRSIRGLDRPMARPQVSRGMAERIHGDMLDLPAVSHGATLQPGHAVDWLIETYLASDGDIVLCPVGPLTNIADGDRKEPRILETIPEIVIMGGAHDDGNLTASAEFNIWLDPEAARMVVNCGRPIRMVPLDATHRALVSTEDAARLQGPRHAGRRGGRQVRPAADRRLRRDAADEAIATRWRAPSTTPWRSARSSTRSILTTEFIPVDVEVQSELSAGRTVCDFRFRERTSPRTSISRRTLTSRSSSGCCWRSWAARPELRAPGTARRLT